MTPTTAVAVVDGKDEDNCKVRWHRPSNNQPHGGNQQQTMMWQQLITMVAVTVAVDYDGHDGR